MARKLFRSEIVIIVGLVLFTLAFYWPTLKCDFVNLDDAVYVYENPHVQQGLKMHEVAWAFGTFHTGNWHPLTWLSHMLDWQFHGSTASWHHATNLFLHVCNTVLLFFVLLTGTGARWQSAFVAALFAWHPLHVESVAWISERKDVLSACFVLLSLFFYVGYAQRSQSKDPRKKNAYLFALIFFVLALMSKPMAVTLPFVFLLLDFWPLQRVTGGEWEVTWQAVRRLVLEKLPFFFLTAGSCFVTFIAQKSGGAVTSLGRLSLASRFFNSVLSYGEYLEKTFWPASLACFYPLRSDMPWPQITVYILSLTAVSMIGFLYRKRHPYFAVGWFWFLGTLVPVIGLVQVGIQAMADRYTYIPLIGIFILLVWSANELCPVRWRKAVGLAGIALVLLLGLLTRAQVQVWKNNFTLYEHALAVAKKNPLVHNNLGQAYEAEGELKVAAEHFNAALALDPDDAKAQDNLGVVLAKMGRPADAVPHFEATLRLAPSNFWAHSNLGMALLETGKADEAISHFLESIRINPGYPEAHMNLAYASALFHRPGVEEHYKKAIELQPDYASAHLNFAQWLAQQGRTSEAISQFEQTLKIDPQSAAAQYGLGAGLYAQGKTEQALLQWHQTLKIDPQHFGALNNLGWIYATDPALHNGEEAVRYAEQASQLFSEPNVSALDTLAAAYAEAGRFEDAVAIARKAIGLVADPKHAELKSKLEKRLELYQEHRPCRG